MGRYSSFRAQRDSEFASVAIASGGSANVSAGAVLAAEGTEYTLSAAPSPDWVIGQIVAISDGTNTGYCRVTRRTTSPSQKVLLLPLNSSRDIGSPIGTNFGTVPQATITGAGVWQDYLSLVIDLTDAPEIPDFYNYAFAMSAAIMADSANAQPLARIVGESLVDDVIGGPGSRIISDDIKTTCLTGGLVSAPPINAAWYATNLDPGQRYYYRLLVAPPSGGTVNCRNARMVAIRADTLYVGEQDAEVTTQSTTSVTVGTCVTPTIPAGTYLVLASMMNSLNYNALHDSAFFRLRDVTAAVSIQNRNWAPAQTSDYDSCGVAQIVTLGVDTTIAWQYRITTDGSKTGGLTVAAKNAVVVVVKLTDEIAEAIHRSITNGTASSLTPQAWNTLCDSDTGASAEALTAGDWIDFIQFGNEASQVLRPVWQSSQVREGHNRGYCDMGQPSGASHYSPRQLMNFWIDGHGRPGGNGKNLLQAYPAVGVTSLDYRGVDFSFLRLAALPSYEHDREIFVAAEIEQGFAFKKWSAGGSDEWWRDFPDWDFVSRVAVNKVDYTQVLDAGDLVAKSWFWDVDAKRLTIKMDPGGDPANATTTVVVSRPLLAARETIESGLMDDQGIVRQYENSLQSVPSVRQEFKIQGSGIEFGNSFGNLGLNTSNETTRDAISSAVFEGQRIRIVRGRMFVHTKLRDCAPLLQGTLGKATWKPLELDADVQDDALTLRGPISSSLINVYRGGTLASDQQVPVIYGTMYGVPAYRTTNNGSGTNTFKVTSLHACKNIGAIESGSFAAKAYGDVNAAAANAIANLDLTATTFTIADTQPDWKADVVYVDVQGITSNGTPSGTLLATPGAILNNIFQGLLSISPRKLHRPSFRLIDRLWRIKTKLDGTKVPDGGVKCGFYFLTETYQQAIAKVCNSVFAGLKQTRAGRYRVMVPGLDAASLTYPNGGFEYDATSYYPWRGRAGATIGLSTTVVFEGSRSAQVSNNFYGDFARTIVFPRPGKYAVTAVVSSQNGEASAFRLGAVLPGDGLKMELSDPVQIDSTGWARATIVVDIPEGCAGTGTVVTIPYRPQGLRLVRPTSGTALKVLLEADSLSLADGDAVATWPDLSGGANDFTQSTSARRPIFRPDVFAGQPGVWFDDIQHAMVVSTGLTLAPPCTVMLVATWGDRFPEAHKGRLLSGSNDWFVGSIVSGGSFLLASQVKADGTLCPASSNSPVIEGGKPVIITLRQISTSQSQLYVNGSQVGSDQAAASQIGPGSLGLGKSWGVGTAEPAGNWYIHAVAAWSASLGATRRTNWETYFGQKYGVRSASINLDNVYVVPIALQIPPVDGDGTAGRNVVLKSVTVDTESYFEAMVPYNVSQQSSDHNSAVLRNDAQARGLAPSYDPTQSEAWAILHAAGRLDFLANNMTGLSDVTPDLGVLSATGVANEVCLELGRQANVLDILATEWETPPETGDFILTEPGLSNFPATPSKFPLWQIIETSDASNPAVVMGIKARRHLDPIADRNEIAPNDLPIGAILFFASGTACPNADWAEQTSMRMFYLQGSNVPDQLNVFGSPFHDHLLDHIHALATHLHQGTYPAVLGQSDAAWEAKNLTLGPFGHGGTFQFDAARGPTDGDHSHSAQAGGNNFNYDNSTAEDSTSPLVTIRTYRGPNDIKSKFGVWCKKVGNVNGKQIPLAAMGGFNQASAPAAWFRADGASSRPSMYGYAPRGADPGNTGFTDRALGANHTQTDAGAWVTVDPTDVNLYQRVTIHLGAFSGATTKYRGIVTQIDAGGGRVFVVPSHETGDSADGTSYTTAGSAKMTTGSCDIGATRESGNAEPNKLNQHLHVKSGSDGTNAVPDHAHKAAHVHAAAGQSKTYTLPQANEKTPTVGTTGYPPIATPLNHGHSVVPSMPENSEDSSNATGTMTGAQYAAPSQIKIPFIIQSQSTTPGQEETAVPAGFIAWCDGALCWQGWSELVEARERIVVGADTSEGIIVSDGGNTHGVDFAQHAYTHRHGDPSSGNYVIQSTKADATQEQERDGFYPEGTQHEELAQHGHVAALVIGSTAATLSATNSKQTGIASGPAQTPPARRWLTCVKN